MSAGRLIHPSLNTFKLALELIYIDLIAGDESFRQYGLAR